MKEIPKHYKLVKEHEHTYEIHDSRDKKNFHVAKKALNLGMHARLAKVQKFDEGGQAQPDRDPASDPSASQDSGRVTVNVNSAPQPSLGVNTAMPQPQAMPVPVPVPVQNAQIPQATIPAMNSKLPLVQQAAQNEKMLENAKLSMANADNQANAESIPAMQENLAAKQELHKKAEESKEKTLQEHQALFDAVMNSKIDPDRYWNNKDTPAKIATGIGLLLGGIGAGMQHSTVNQALSVFQNRIKEDIESQKEDLGKKRTLLSDNLEKYKAIDPAVAASIMQLNAIMEGKMQLAAAKTGNAKTIAGMQAAIAANRQSYLKEIGPLSLEQLKVDAVNDLNETPRTPTAAENIIKGNGPDGKAPVGSSPAGGGGELDAGLSTSDINVKKLNAMKMAGIIDKEEGDKIGKEVSQLRLNQQAKKLIKEKWDDIENAIQTEDTQRDSDGNVFNSGIARARVKEAFERLPGVGPMISDMSLGTETGRKFDKARKSAELQLNKVFSNRVSEPVLALLRSLIPTGNESRKERQDLLKSAFDEIDKSTDTTGLENRKLINRR